MAEVLNPVDVERAIADTANEIAANVRTVSELYTKFRAAEREYDLAFAQEYMAFPGAAHAKRYAAEIATTQLRQGRDDAEGLWRFADRKMRALETQLSAYQSINRSVTGMYGAAGRG